QALLAEVAKLPNNNVIVPRALQVIQKAVNTCMGDAYRAVPSVNEYLDTVLDINRKPKMPRAQREEVWIEKVFMDYDQFDAVRALIKGTGSEPTGGLPPTGAAVRPGWGIVIHGCTTHANAPKRIEECL